MRIFLSGEGRHDHGIIEWSARARDFVDREGWLQPAVRNTASGAHAFVFSRVERSNLVALSRQNKPNLRGHGLKTFLALRRAEREGYDGIVFMVDADTRDVGGWREKVNQITEAWQYKMGGIFTICCVPMSMSESWLLGDENTWSEFGHPNIAELPGAPESLWGDRHDPTSDHPKHVFARTCSRCDVSDSRDTRREIMHRSRRASLLRRCPQSYQHFCSQIDDYQL